MSHRRSGKTSQSAEYQRLEMRRLLATFVVNTTADTVELDGKISLREAIVAANTNQPFGDAPAGSANAQDEIESSFPANRGPIQLRLGAFEITDGVKLTGFEIDGQSRSRIFDIQTTDRVDLNYVRVENGFANEGGAVFAHNTNLHLERFHAKNSRAHSGNGGAVLIQGGSLTGKYNSFVNNKAAGFGGAISVESHSTFDDANSRFNDSYSANGGGGIAILDSLVSLDDSGIFGNWTSSLQGGGGIFMSTGAEAVIANTPLEGNRSTRAHGGGIYADRRSNMMLSNASLFGNEAAQNGGGIFMRGGNLTFDSRDEPFPNQRQTTLAENAAKRNGGGVFLQNSTAQLALFSMYGNRAGRQDTTAHGFGGSIFSANSAISMRGHAFAVTGQAYHAGGGIALLGGRLDVDSNVSNPLESTWLPLIGGEVLDSPMGTPTGVKAGGGIFARGATVNLRGVQSLRTSLQSAVDYGGFIYAGSGTDVKLNELRITNGAKIAGGGIFIAGNASGVLKNSVVDSSGASRGGAIASHGKLQVTDSLLSFNEANLSYGSQIGSGGAIFNTGELVVHGTDFHFNEASRGGGLAGFGDINISASTFRNNDTPDYSGRYPTTFGGAIHSTAKVLELNDVEFTFNIAPRGGAIAFSGESLIGSHIRFGGDGEWDGNRAKDGARHQKPGWGGALYLSGNSHSVFSNTTFHGNTASQAGGAVALIAGPTGTPTLSINNSSFLANSTDADVHAIEPAPVFGGGAILNKGGFLDLRDILFSENMGKGYGGAIANSDQGQMILHQVEFSENHATLFGGAIFNDAQMNLFDSIFEDNVADLGFGGVFFGINSETSLVRIKNSGNSA